MRRTALPISALHAPQRFLPPVSFPYGTYHASELQYLFDTASVIPSPGLGPDQQALADAMVVYWSNFAKRADPNGAPPTWSGYTSATDTHQSLAPAAIAPITTFGADHKCGFWAPTP
jgi:para-nitrobenzyl esterase